ncbi:helix-turn-helix DNA-binding domain protein [Gordonia phage TinaLin]|uniref:Helix-turn-helix DNA-binding domain protein n=1 Tax=Gordonia phage TinaLin TaxID=2797324 RepID=A0A7T7GTK8_9CAUD|nr:helix-turn-helix DNA binding domain protein [Gordonia phage TinaLin]QQM15128.1 helix-turn-helix DNA-binding domain protein [Gordonia phage TinaLin]
MKVAEAAKRAGCHPETIRRALWSGALKGHQAVEPNGVWRIRPEDLDAWAFGEVASVTVTK